MDHDQRDSSTQALLFDFSSEESIEVSDSPALPARKGRKARRTTNISVADNLQSRQSADVDIDAIVPNPHQPRVVFRDELIVELAQSIAHNGLLQPIVVRRINASQYQLVVGERRWRACKQLGWTAIRACIAEMTDLESAIAAIAENKDRSDLTDYEFARTLIKTEMLFKSRTEMADAYGLVRSELYRYLNFADLPDFIIVDLEAHPDLLSHRFAAEVVSVIGTHGEGALEALKILWPQVVSGKLKNSKLAEKLKAYLCPPQGACTEKTNTQLIIDGKSVGSISRDSDHVSIRLKLTSVTEGIADKIISFVEQFVSAGSEVSTLASAEAASSS